MEENISTNMAVFTCFNRIKTIDLSAKSIGKVSNVCKQFGSFYHGYRSQSVFILAWPGLQFSNAALQLGKNYDEIPNISTLANIKISWVDNKIK